MGRGLTILFIIFSTVAEGWSQLPKSIFTSSEQTDLIEILVKALNIKLKEKPPDRNRTSFSIIPVSTSNAGGEKIFVSSINAAFMLGNRDSTNVSSIYFLPYTNFSDNFGFGITQNLWTNGNTWNIPSDFRISSQNQYSYGLGSSSKSSDEFTLRYNTVRANFNIHRKVFNYFYSGPGIQYNRFYSVSVKNAPVLPSPFEKYGVGTEQNTFSTGLTANYLYDNRKNSINPDQGTYAAMTIRFNPAWLGNEDLWTSVYLDGRHYFPLDLKKRKVLALWAFYWGSFGNVPYFNLPGTALEFNARSGRGFPQARFRGKHMLYFESEYRFDITRNGLLGATLFANFQSLTEPVTNTFAYINPAVGFGARIKFNKESNTNLTIDFGFGKNYTGVYIGLGEFF